MGAIFIEGGGGGGGFDLSTLTPNYLRGDGLGGKARIENALTIGHRYLISVCNLYTSGTSVNLAGQIPTTTGLDVDFAAMYGNGAGNSNQRPFGCIIQGTATSTSFTLDTGTGALEASSGRWALVYFDLDA